MYRQVFTHNSIQLSISRSISTTNVTRMLSICCSQVLACSRMYPCVTPSYVVRMFLVGTRMYPCVTRMLPVRYPHVPVWCFSLRFVSYNCSAFGLGLNLPNVRSSKSGLNSYPDSDSFYLGYQSFFSHAAGILGVGRRPTHLRPQAEAATKTFTFRAGNYKDRKEKPLPPRVDSFFSGTCLPDSNNIHKQFYRTNYGYYHYNVTGRICGTLCQKI